MGKNFDEQFSKMTDEEILNYDEVTRLRPNGVRYRKLMRKREEINASRLEKQKVADLELKAKEDEAKYIHEQRRGWLVWGVRSIILGIISWIIKLF